MGLHAVNVQAGTISKMGAVIVAWIIVNNVIAQIFVIHVVRLINLMQISYAIFVDLIALLAHRTEVVPLASSPKHIKQAIMKITASTVM